MCCRRLAANAGPKKVAKTGHLGTIAQLCRAISSQLRHVSRIGKNLLSSNTSSTRPRNMVNLGQLTAEIGSGVWGTPTNYNRFRVLAALLHGTLVVGISQTAELNRGRAPPIFGRAAIMLGIGPHSSLWPPCITGCGHIYFHPVVSSSFFMVGLWNRADHYIFMLWFVMVTLCNRTDHSIFAL